MVAVAQAALHGELDRQYRKILIVSTPKSGNHWLKQLFATLYELPQAELPRQFERAAFDRLGPRWVGHEHYYPGAELLRWAQQHHVTLVTIIRHPGDVLLSLHHYIKNYKDSGGFNLKDAVIAASDDDFAERASAYVRNFFYVLLNISISWMYAGRSQVVRYEDLWRDPAATLAELTSRIHPVSNDQIERAIEQCDISLVRSLAGEHQKFYRQGTVGNWRRELPPPVVELLRTCDPYPAQFAALGYTLDPDDPLIAAPPRPRSWKNPFRAISHFDHGVEVPAAAVRLYLSFDSAQARQRWPNPASTDGPETFYAWLNAPADKDRQGSAGMPMITNLAAFFHALRPDLRAKFPDLFGHDRVAYVTWFLQHVQQEYQLDPAFVEPVKASYLAWANAPATRDTNPEALLLTNFAAAIYQQRPDLHPVFPDPYGRDRADFLYWYIQYGANEHAIERDRVDPVKERFLGWATAPDAADPRKDAGDVPPITNLAAHTYRNHPQAPRLFPDIYGTDRLSYILWFLEQPHLAEITRPIMLSLARSYLHRDARQ